MNYFKCFDTIWTPIVLSKPFRLKVYLYPLRLIIDQGETPNNEASSMKCLRNTDKNCSCTQITPDWEEYPACMTGKECNYHPESFSVFVPERETEILGMV